jgi:cob(I)alamin adenosyltransferase
MPHLSNTLTKTLQAVQNTAFKCIYKLYFKTHTEEVVKILGVDLIRIRAVKYKPKEKQFHYFILLLYHEN